MKQVVFINAGHSKNDPGAVFESHIERDLVMTIRDGVGYLLEDNGFNILKIPDDLRLTQSIDWVNANSSNIGDGLALSIHLNAGGGEGAETFHFAGSQTSYNIAKSLIDAYCKITGLRSRGAKPDSQARYGGLSWIQRTDVWATLIELAFIDNIEDMVYILDNIDKVVEGIVRGVCAIYGVVFKPTESEDNDPGNIDISALSREQKKELGIKIIREL